MNITSDQNKNCKSPILQAAEDAIVTFAFTMVSALLALGWPPQISSVYVPALSAGLIGIVAYAKARNITVSD